MVVVAYGVEEHYMPLYLPVCVCDHPKTGVFGEHHEHMLTGMCNNVVWYV